FCLGRMARGANIPSRSSGAVSGRDGKRPAWCRPDMNRKSALVCLTTAVVVVCLSACGGSSGDAASTKGSGGAGGASASGGAGGSCPTPPKTGDIPDDVATVMAAKCWGCHSNPPRSHAPFPLISYEDLIKDNPLQPGHLIVRTMAQVILPDATRPSGLP